MKQLVLDTNALYRLSEDRSFFPRLKKRIRKEYEVVVAPLVLVESMTRALLSESFRKKHIKYAFQKLKDFSPKVLLDQDELFQMVAQNKSNIYTSNNMWSLVINHLNRCYYKKDNDHEEDLYYRTKNGERRIAAYDWTLYRNKWEQQYQTDWHTMLASIPTMKNKTQKKAYANNLMIPTTWDNVILHVFQQRSGCQVQPSDQPRILDFMKYIGAEYQTIWYNALVNGYHPYSNKNKNDYNDMHLLLYSALPDVYLLTFDYNMFKKVQTINTMGKIIDGWNFL